MDSSLVWLSLVLTGSFGLWGVYATLRHRYAGRITFVKIEEIWLFDDIVRDLPELEVLYRDRPVSERLVLLTGALINTGWKDITQSMVTAPLELGLPDRMRWSDVKIISHSEDVHGKASVGDGRKLVFETGMFRRKEFIRFQALVQLGAAEEESGLADSQDPDLQKHITCSHRIADTAPVRKTELIQEEQEGQVS